MAKKKRNQIVLTMGERIEELRISKAMTQQDLAQVMGVSRATVAKWEVDPDYNASYKDMIKLALYFQVSADYLLGLSGEASPKVDLQAIHRKTGLTKAALKSLIYFKEHDHVLGDKTKSTDKCDALSRILSSLSFLDSVTSLLLIEKSDHDSTRPMVAVLNSQNPADPYYFCHLPPEALYEYQSYRLIPLLRDIRDGKIDNKEYVEFHDQFKQEGEE
jgi:transcriptional regulator with XRE-family HTH domain